MTHDTFIIYKADLTTRFVLANGAELIESSTVASDTWSVRKIYITENSKVSWATKMYYAWESNYCREKQVL